MTRGKLANWNASNATWTTGDFTGDGYVDGADLNVLLCNWLRSTPPLGIVETTDASRSVSNTQPLVTSSATAGSAAAGAALPLYTTAPGLSQALNTIELGRFEQHNWITTGGAPVDPVDSVLHPILQNRPDRLRDGKKARLGFPREHIDLSHRWKRGGAIGGSQ